MTPSRPYSSDLRTEQTAVTRRRILDAAGRLFVERGYHGTTLAAVAEAAGVSVQTVYNVVGGKSLLLKAVYDVTLAGDDEPISMIERPEYQAVLSATDGLVMLSHYAHIVRLLAERVLPLVAGVLAQAASGDADLQAFARTIEGERARGTTLMAEHIASHFGLRTGLSVQDAADVLWTMTAPDITDRLVNRRGWSWDKFERWMADLLADAVLAGPGDAGDTEKGD